MRRQGALRKVVPIQRPMQPVTLVFPGLFDKILSRQRIGSGSTGRSSIGNSSASHCSRPPARGATSKPRCLSLSATRALDASLGHVQNNTSGRSRESFSTSSSNTSSGTRMAVGIVRGKALNSMRCLRSATCTRSPAAILAWRSSG